MDYNRVPNFSHPAVFSHILQSNVIQKHATLSHTHLGERRGKRKIKKHKNTCENKFMTANCLEFFPLAAADQKEGARILSERVGKFSV